MNLDSHRPLLTRAVAFLWGFFFVYLFRYTLDNLYPFLSGQFSLSFFAFSLLFIGWLSYYFFYKRSIPRTHFSFDIILAVIIFLNLFLILFFFAYYGESGYIFYNPFFFSLQIILFYFLYFSRLPLLVFHPLLIMLGTLAGFGLLKLVSQSQIVLFIGALIAAVPAIMIEEITEKNPGRLRMIPLRRSIDIMRFLLLALSLFGIFDQFRGRFYTLAALLYAGPALQYFITRIDQKKHHIKHGTIALAVLFLGLSLAYQEIPFTYWAAAGFSALTFWEALYFKKMYDGDYRHNIMSIGAVLAITMLLYMLTADWVILIFGVIFIGLQLRIIIYLFKNHRKILGFLFALSITSWAFGVMNKYQDSFTRNFFALTKTTTVGEKAPSIYWPLYFQKSDKTIVTNIYPREVIEKADFSELLPRMMYATPSGVFLTLKIRTDRMFDKDYVYFYRLNLLKAYNTQDGFSELERFSKELPELYFYSDKPPYKSYMAPNIDRLVLTKNISEKTKLSLYAFGMNLANWYEKNSKYNLALDVYKEMLENFDNRELFIKTAKIYGISGDIKNQINFLEKAVQNSISGTSPDIAEIKLLMELYFYDSRYDKSLELAEHLVKFDVENRFAYLEWIFKILKQTGGRYDWINFLRRIDRINLPHDDKNFLRQETLYLEIRETIDANPDQYEIIQREKKRQEKIEVP
ncbi:MAG: hypothetical protein ABUK01_19210 [Leptospirales bacterium]